MLIVNLVARCSLFVVRCSLFVVCCSLFVVRCLGFGEELPKSLFKYMKLTYHFCDG